MLLEPADKNDEKQGLRKYLTNTTGVNGKSFWTATGFTLEKIYFRKDLKNKE